MGVLPRKTGGNYKRTTILKSLEMVLGATANEEIFSQENLLEVSNNGELVVTELGCAPSHYSQLSRQKLHSTLIQPRALGSHCPSPQRATFLRGSIYFLPQLLVAGTQS